VVLTASSGAACVPGVSLRSPNGGPRPERTDPVDCEGGTAYPAFGVRPGGDPHVNRHRLHRLLAWYHSQIAELLTPAAAVDT
jgi:hypothetical protein